MHHPAGARHVPVHVSVGGGVAGRLVRAVQRRAIEVADDHRFRGQVGVGDAAGLDDHQVAPAGGDARRDVAGCPRDQATGRQRGVQAGHLFPGNADGGRQRRVGGEIEGHFPFSCAAWP
jgi:hypothetical protein